MDYGKIRELIISKAKNSFEAAHAITSLDEIYEKDHHSKPTPRDEKNYYKDTNLETFYFDTKINVGGFGTISEPAIMKAENDMIAKELVKSMLKRKHKEDEDFKIINIERV